MVINNLTETHCHILPKIDDGSKSVEMSIEMINMLKAQGAEAIILTPHYYSDSISLEDFLARRDRSFNMLKESLPKGSPSLYLGAEVYMSSYLFNYENLDRLCVGNSRYMLVEHRFSCDFGKDTFDRLTNLYYDYQIKPILAHIERYDALMSDKELLKDYIDMGCLTQVNINAFVNSTRKQKKKLFKYLEYGLIHLIGSDCHNLDRRPPNYQDGINEIVKKYGTQPIEEFEKNAKRLLEGTI